MTAGPNQVKLTCSDHNALRNLGVFAARALSLDEQALVRIRSRKSLSTVPASSTGNPRSSTDGGISLSHVWTKTPFGPLGCRTVAVTSAPDDAVLNAKGLLEAVKIADQSDTESGAIAFDAGVSTPAAWPGFLPVEKGWQVREHVPAQVFRRLEEQARKVAKDNSGPLGLPTSLLDQAVIDIEDQPTRVTMRDVFALCSMGFIPTVPDEKEPVRISSLGRWHRLDGRFGSVYTLEGFSVLPLA